MKNVAKYILIANKLRQSILEKEYDINEKLPNEENIAKMYNVSRITVRKALEELEKENYIYKIQGSGSYVKNNTIQDFNPNKFEIFDFEKMEVEITNFEIKIPTVEMCQKLQINDLDYYYEVNRIIKFNKKNIGYQVINLPAKIIQGIRLDIFNFSIYGFISDELSLSLSYATRSLKIIENYKSNINLHNIFVCSNLLSIKQSSYIGSGQLIEYTESYIDTEFYTLNEIIYP